jgi:hypothetical protein
MKSILHFNQLELLELNINESINQLKFCGINARFVGHSFANGCSIYFKDESDNKYRFSDHTVTNISRCFNEFHFGLPYRKTGSIANQCNCQDKSKYGFRESFVMYNDNAKMCNVYFNLNMSVVKKSYSYIF